MRIVETDNYGRDYPDERFLNLPPLPIEAANMIADTINRAFPLGDRWWKVVADDYTLLPGFEP